jgi:hypothetical protein
VTRRKRLVWQRQIEAPSTLTGGKFDERLLPNRIIDLLRYRLLA